MTDAGWETLSDQAVAVAGVVYFLALLSHLVEWSALRHVPVGRKERARTAVGVGPGSDTTHIDAGPVEQSPDHASERHRAALFGRLGLLLTVIAAGVHLVSLVGRGMAADPNRVPWGNMYEFTLAGTFFVTLGYLVLLRRNKWEWLAPIVVGFVLACLMIDVVWLHTSVAPLREALLSPWLVIHVVSAVIATGGFTLGGMLSILYLVKTRRGDQGTYLARVPDLATLDRMSYRVHAFAFPVWTFAVLITGPIWAHEAWARYWNWDPKEVWAFITWVVYAAYLHARATAGWKGSRAAWVSIVGLLTLWFNFIGINYFSTTSMHSYAAPTVQVLPLDQAGGGSD
ncbi:MAG: c-type cytochrome biogenesis protein CcsB [Nocardioides sp.]